MRMLSATDVAIAIADDAGTLIVEDCDGRFGPYVAIRDEHGLIEVHNTRPEWDVRIADIRGRVSPAPRTSSREPSRCGRGCWAISPAGRSKSKSRTSTGGSIA